MNLQCLRKLKQNFQKNKAVTGKFLLFVICPFCTHILFALTLTSDWAAFYGNGAFSILVFFFKKWYFILFQFVSKFKY